MKELGLCEECYAEIYPLGDKGQVNEEKVAALRKVIEERFPAAGLRYGPTPVINVWRIDKDAEIPPVEGIDELFMVRFKMGDKEYTASLTRADAALIVTDLARLIGEAIVKEH